MNATDQQIELPKYYRVIAEPAAGSRWYLKAPIASTGAEVDPRIFTRGGPVEVQPSLTLPIRSSGVEMTFNFCDFDMVVTRATLNQALASLTGTAVQRFPVTLENGDKQYEILNVCESMVQRMGAPTRLVSSACSLISKSTQPPQLGGISSELLNGRLP